MEKFCKTNQEQTMKSKSKLNNNQEQTNNCKENNECTDNKT